MEGINLKFSIHLEDQESDCDVKKENEENCIGLNFSGQQENQEIDSANMLDQEFGVYKDDQEFDSEKEYHKVKKENEESDVEQELSMLHGDQNNECDQELQQSDDDMEGADLVLVFGHSKEDEQETGCREALQWVKKEGEEQVFDEVKEEQSQEQSPTPQERTDFRQSDKICEKRLKAQDKTKTEAPDGNSIEGDQEENGRNTVELQVYISDGPRKKRERRKRQSPVSCTVCGKRFPKNKELTRHMTKHTDERHYTCEICGKGFKLKGILNVHMTTHSDESLYICNFCGKVYKAKPNLTRHMKTHSEERPVYTCELCAKRFTDESNLSRHMKIHSGEKPFTCIVCGNRFSRQYVMTAHMRMHSEEISRPYTCHVCGKGFPHQNNVKQHMKVHSGEKPFTCNLCGKGFAWKGDYTKHMRIHRGEKPFTCNVCGNGFNRQDVLTIHMRRHHGVSRKISRWGARQ